MTTPSTDATGATTTKRAVRRSAYRAAASPFAQRFGELVLYARKAKCMAQRDVAKLVGCSQPHIWQLERGCVDPDLTLAAKLMDVLSIDYRLVFDVGARRRKRAA